MSHENQQLAYKCRQLKSATKIHSTWFFNNVVNFQLTERWRIHKIFHVTDIDNVLEKYYFEEYIITLLFNLINQSNNIIYKNYSILININFIVRKSSYKYNLNFLNYNKHNFLMNIKYITIWNVLMNITSNVFKHSSIIW